MKKVNLKLGSVKSMLTKQEMKQISGGYLMCCCTGGYYGTLSCNNSWSTGPNSSGNCYLTCTDSHQSHPGTGGEAWGPSSLCNFWSQCGD